MKILTKKEGKKLREAQDKRAFNTRGKVLKELDRMEGIFGVGTDGNKAFCPDNGQPYDTVVWAHNGSCVKGEGYPALTFPTPEAAWALWFAAFNQYQSTRWGKIYWRRRPELEKNFTGYMVYARLFIGGDGGDGKA